MIFTAWSEPKPYHNITLDYSSNVPSNALNTMRPSSSSLRAYVMNLHRHQWEEKILPKKFPY